MIEPTYQYRYRVGNLPTMNSDRYPALEAWWVQVWQGEKVFARVYGATPKQARDRAVTVVGALNKELEK